MPFKKIFSGRPKKNGAASEPESGFGSPAHAFETYQRMVRAGQEVPPRLYNELGDQCRDLGDEEKAGVLYEKAALGFMTEEAWTNAEAVLKKLLVAKGIPAYSAALVALEISLGKGLSGQALASIGRLEKTLAPSDAAAIDRLLALLDRYSAKDPAVESRAADLLCMLARPEQALARLRLALRLARTRGETSLLVDIEHRIANLSPDLSERRNERSFHAPQDDIARPQGHGSDQPSAPVSIEPPRSTAPAAPQIDAPAVPRAEEPKESVSYDGLFLPDLSGIPAAGAAQTSGSAAGRGGQGDHVTPGTGDAIRHVVPTPGRTSDAFFSRLVEQFRDTVRNEAGEDGAAEHYDLAVGLLGIGMFDDAIGEFQLALRDESFRLRSLEGLAECFVAQGDAALAARLIEDTMPLLADAKPADRIGVLYWLARALEEGGELVRARSLLQQIALVEMSFRDVRERLRKLK